MVTHPGGGERHRRRRGSADAGPPDASGQPHQQQTQQQQPQHDHNRHSSAGAARPRVRTSSAGGGDPAPWLASPAGGNPGGRRSSTEQLPQRPSWMPPSPLSGTGSALLSEDGLLLPPPMDEPPPDAGFAGHELYRALRGAQGDDPLADELLWDGDFMASQREFIQKKQDDELLQRLERRMGRIRAAPSQGGVQDATAPVSPAQLSAEASSLTGGAGQVSFAGLALAAGAGARLLNVFGRGRVMSVGGQAADALPPSTRASLSGGTGLPGGSASGGTAAAFAAAPEQLRHQGGSEHGMRLEPAPEGNEGAAATPRLLLPSSPGVLAAPGALKGTAAQGVQGGSAVLLATPSSDGTAAPHMPPLGAGADGVVQVQLAPAAASTAPAKAAPQQQQQQPAEALERMDTDTQLQASLAQCSWLRRTAIRICTSPDFELVVMLVIAANCVSLALYNPLEDEASSHNATLAHLDLGLNIAFTVEMLLRVASMGGPLAYLSHPWNVFDCLMVAAGYTMFIPAGSGGGAGMEGVKALRALRALRPLRTITRFPALRSIVVCFLEAVPLLVSVVTMLFFFLFLFAVAAVEIFGEAFHFGCTNPATGAMEGTFATIPDEFSCGARSCPAEFSECREYPASLAHAIAGFDNVGVSMMSVFQAMTLTNWSFTMFRTMDYLSPAVVVYWLVMVVFGAYFVLNLFLAVLKTKFAKAKNLLDNKRRQRRAMRAGQSNGKKRNMVARASGWLKGRVSSYVSSRAGQDSLSSHISSVVAKKAASDAEFFTPRSDLTGFTEFVGVQTGAGHASAQVLPGRAPPAAKSVRMAAGAPDVLEGGSMDKAAAAARRVSRMDSVGSGASGYSGYSSATGLTGLTGASAVSTECLLSLEEFDDSVADLPPVKRALLRAQYRVRVVVCSGWFNTVFLLAIALNTVCLAIVYDGMSHELEEALAQANMAFTLLFTAEMAAKLVGLGPWAYLTDAWLLFDAVVVAFSIVELVTELMARTSGGGLTALRSVRSLRVLRSFRVLRVMKMFKYLESLKVIAAVLISSMASFASIVVLLVLFWLVFAIVGLHVFGGLALDNPWPNFDTLIASLILTFNILNLEEFESNWFSVVRASNQAASMYYLAWIIVGKFIFLTLFLAVTLDAFERKYEADLKRGTRSMSVAGSVMSRIKRAGAKIKSLAGTVAGSGSARSGMLRGIWGRSQHTARSEAAAQRADSASASPAISNTDDGGLLPGQAMSGRSSRRSTMEQRSAAPGPQHGRMWPPGAAPRSGPVAEGAASADEFAGLPVWGSGLRLRRLRVSMLQQCGRVGPTPPDGSSKHGDDSVPACLRRSSSDSDGDDLLQQQAAAAFAASAASQALLPCHVLPDLADTHATGDGAAMLQELLNPQTHEAVWGQALRVLGLGSSVAPSSRLASRSSSVRSSLDGAGTAALGGSSSAEAAQDTDFTWHEFLATVAAINYPSAAQRQQKQLQLQQQQQQQEEAAAKGQEGRVPGLLRPIAEGFESSPPPTARVHASARQAAGELTAAVSFSFATAQGLAPQEEQAATGWAPSSSSPAPPPRLALEEVECSDLELPRVPPVSGEPRTPCLLLQDTSHDAADGMPITAQAGEAKWVCLEGDAAAALHADARPPSASSAPPPATGPAAAVNTGAPKPPRAPRDPTRRVTLFTESMRARGECPAPPRSPRFAERPGSCDPQQAAASALKPAAAGQPCDLDRLLAAAAAPGADLLASIGGSPLDAAPCITTAGIKRRKAAAAAAALAAPQAVPLAAIAESVDASEQPPVGQEGAFVAGGEGSSSQVLRRASRATSDNLSDAGLSDGGHSYLSGGGSAGSRSGAWSTASGPQRQRSRTFPELAGTSLWLLPAHSRLRRWLYRLVTCRAFDYAMFLLIILNCVAMAYEYPDMSQGNLDGAILFYSDIVFTAAFGVEAFLKVAAFGFRPYLGFFQNQVDLLIVVSSVVMLVLDTVAGLSIVKGLRVLRAIKPLRALTRSAGMQLILKSLTLSLAAMGNVSIVVLLFFLIFAILGVQLFHGKFWSCNDRSVTDRGACVGSFQQDGQDVPRQWSNAEYTFDHLGSALVSLFVTATLNGYLDIMNAAMAAPEEPGLQPHAMSNWPAFYFFVAFVLVVAYTLLNLYIGVVFYQFGRIRMQSQTGSAFLTDDQTEWVELSRLVFRLKPPEKTPVPANPLRRRLYYLVQSRPFEYALMVAIVANSALLATTHYGQPGSLSAVVDAINYAFTGLYALEAALKVAGLGWRNYAKNPWNKFDALLLATGLLDMFVSLFMGGGAASFLKVQKVMRLLRLARVVKLMRGMKGLRSLFGTLIASLPAFWNVGALLGLMFFMYAYVGMLLLGKIKRNGGLNEHSNFERFWTAALTLFKIATNDNWTDVMTACLIGPPDCDPSAGECGSWVVYPFFVSFVVLVSIIMLQLFTAVIIETFEAQEEQDHWKLRPDHLDEFVELWAEYDDGSGTIDPADLEGMLLRLSPPLGLGSSASSTDVLRFVFDLDIPLLGGRVPFQRTAYELVRRCSSAEIPQGLLKDQIDRLVTRAFKNLKADEVLNFSVAVTVMRVQRKWRARMRAAKLKRKREFRADRGVVPPYADVVAARDTIMRDALRRRQAGDLRWRPHAAYARQWGAAEAALAAEAAAAAAASRRSSGGSGGAGGEEGGGRWGSLAGIRTAADGWMTRVTERIRDTGGRLFARSSASGRSASSFWGAFASSRGTSRTGTAAVSAATSRAGSVAPFGRAGSSSCSEQEQQSSTTSSSSPATAPNLDSSSERPQNKVPVGVPGAGGDRRSSVRFAGAAAMRTER